MKVYHLIFICIKIFTGHEFMKTRLQKWSGKLARNLRKYDNLEVNFCAYAEAQQKFNYCTSLVRRLLFTNH
jgi:hypothetical protein